MSEETERKKGVNTPSKDNSMKAHAENISQGAVFPIWSPAGEQKLEENQLVSFGERITYVFANGKDVASIHFDRERREIFFKGHNVRNMDLEEWQMQRLEEMRRLLMSQEKGREFAGFYGKTLDKIVLEKSRQTARS